MTGKAFLKRLMFQLDFLSQDDQKTVIGFYEKKLTGASSAEEEEAIVKSFGSPEHIAEKLKETYMMQQAASATEAPLSSDNHTENTQSLEEEENHLSSEETKEESLPAEAAEADSIPSSENESKSEEKAIIAEENAGSDESILIDNQETAGIIFSKPAQAEKSAEVIQSFENKEVKTLYGEKVFVGEETEEKEDVFPDPSDAANGLTAEEIDRAKAETLIKAESYNTASFGVNAIADSTSDSNDAPVSEEESEQDLVYPEEQEQYETEEEQEEESPDKPGSEEEKRYYKGIFNQMFENSSLSHGAILALKILLTLLISPALILIIGGGLILYTVTASVVLLCAAVLFVIMAAFVVAGIVELIYGFTLLFETVSVALIELGVGTVLFAIVTAAVGLIYEFLFGITPKALKGITRVCIYCIRWICCQLYGGKA
jgi:uncharacterized membrane protein